MSDPAMILTRADLTEKDIANVLRNGPSPTFLAALAAMLDPPRIQWQHPPQPGEQRPEFKQPRYRLRLANAVTHRPAGSATFDRDALGEAMLALDHLPRGQAKAEKARLLDRFGVSSRTAEAAKQRARELQDLWEWMQARSAEK